MDEKVKLSFEIQMEALITEREMMVSENQQRVHRGESMAYTKGSFEALIVQFNNLREELLRNG